MQLDPDAKITERARNERLVADARPCKVPPR
jgi:hypothetical protein